MTAASPDILSRRSSGRDLLAGTGAHHVARQAKELHHLLRFRLLVVVAVMVGFWGVLPIGSVIHMFEPTVPQGARDVLVLQLVLAGAIALMGLVLWLRPPTRISHLRAFELAMFGAGFVILAVTNAYFIQRFGLIAPPISPTRHPVIDMAGTRVDPVTIRWFVFIIGYGTLVPNTLRRTAAIVLFIALSALALITGHAIYNGVTPVELTQLMVYPTVWMAVAVVVSVFGSYRVSLLERRVQDIERLGQYRLVKHLGKGGMGDVYLAEHVLLKQPFAVKMLHPDRLTDPRQLTRFEREVQAMAQLEHWNTVEIYDYGHGADGSFYYVMEYLPGLTLEELVWKAGPLPAARAIRFLKQICAALDEAHHHGLLHRDIKPANVIVCERAGIHDVAKLLDFGLVKHFEDPGDSKLTIDGHIAGTPAYMSPEQSAGDAVVDARSDVYSLGALGYFLLTRRPPFTGRTATQLLAAHMYEEPRPVNHWRPDAPPGLAAIVAKCLAKKPEDRYESAAAVSLALSACDACGEWSQKDAEQWWLANGPRN